MLIDLRGFNQALRGLDPWVEGGGFRRASREGVPTWLRLLDDGRSIAIRVQRSKWNSAEFGGEFKLSYTRALRPLGLLTREEGNDDFNTSSFGGSLSGSDVREFVDITNSVIGRLIVPTDLAQDVRMGDQLATEIVNQSFTPLEMQDFNPVDTWIRYVRREDLERWVAFIGPRLVADVEEQLGFRLTVRR